jgi:ADP-heptose:LPS heptosyltransferase
VSLRTWAPQARITWLVQQGFEDAIAAHPAVDEVLPFPRGQWKRWWLPHQGLAALRWLGGLRGRFDFVLDAQGLGRSGVMAWFTHAPRRIGFADARELGWLGCNERHRVAAVHAVDRMLGLLAAAGVPPIADLGLTLRLEDRAWWTAERARRGLVGRYAVLAPTSRWASKDWPSTRWQALAEPLVERGFDRLLLLGTAAERAKVAEAMPRGDIRSRIVDLAGMTTVGQGMAVIAAADLVVANDSAPLHIAVGFGRPLLALFGPTDPAAVGPYGRSGCVLRGPGARAFRGTYRDRGLDDRLMAEITVDEVLAAFDAGLARSGLAPLPAGAVR